MHLLTCGRHAFNRLTFVACWAVAIMTGAALFTVAGTNLGNGNLWYDEAGQYWISLGQNHAAPLLSPEGSLWDVWQVGKKFNSDPGGYTLIMRAIINLFGSGPAYLHMCSFVFFILGIAATYLLAREARLSPLVAAASQRSRSSTIRRRTSHSRRVSFPRSGVSAACLKGGFIFSGIFRASNFGFIPSPTCC